MFFLEILQRRFTFVLDQLEMQSYFFMVVYIVLNFENFKYADLIYHFMVEEFLK